MAQKKRKGRMIQNTQQTKRSRGNRQLNPGTETEKTQNLNRYFN